MRVNTLIWFVLLVLTGCGGRQMRGIDSSDTLVVKSSPVEKQATGMDMLYRLYKVYGISSDLASDPYCPPFLKGYITITACWYFR